MHGVLRSGVVYTGRGGVLRSGVVYTGRWCIEKWCGVHWEVHGVLRSGVVYTGRGGIEKWCGVHWEGGIVAGGVPGVVYS